MTTKKEVSRKQESLIADYLNWNVITGSGSRPLAPGDVEGLQYLGECKTHETSGYTIQFMEETWKKISKEAHSKFKLPVYFVDDGTQRLDATWVMFNFVPTGNIIVSSYPCKVKRNIIFNSKDLIQESRRVSDLVDIDGVVYQYRGWASIVYITTIHTFKYIVEG